jgi:glycosyltransferase involved in cell wall biosynthesis
MPKNERNKYKELEPECDSTSLDYYKKKLIGYLCNGQHKDASIWLGDLAENTPQLVRTFFSIILITKNRGDRIRNTIRALKKISYPPSRYEIIIVDNGSTDNTREVVYEELADASCETKYVVQPAGSLCAARNAGIDIALGNWVGFIDDDAVCNPDWILFYLYGLLTIPEAVGMGGPIDLPPEYQKPAWWRSRHSGLLSCKRTTEEISRAKILDFPYGTNMWLNRSIFNEIGKFDERLDDPVQRNCR